MHCRRFAQFVGDKNANDVAFNGLDGGAGRTAVVSPGFDASAGRKFMVNFFSNQMKLFYTVSHAPGQRTAIGCDNWHVSKLIAAIRGVASALRRGLRRG